VQGGLGGGEGVVVLGQKGHGFLQTGKERI